MCTQVFDQKVESKRAIEGEREKELGARERERVWSERERKSLEREGEKEFGARERGNGSSIRSRRVFLFCMTAILRFGNVVLIIDNSCDF